MQKRPQNYLTHFIVEKMASELASAHRVKHQINEPCHPQIQCSSHFKTLPFSHPDFKNFYQLNTRIKDKWKYCFGFNKRFHNVIISLWEFNSVRFFLMLWITWHLTSNTVTHQVSTEETWTPDDAHGQLYSTYHICQKRKQNPPFPSWVTSHMLSLRGKQKCYKYW